MGIEKLDPRRLAEKITSGSMGSQHLGQQTEATLNQEIFSLKNTNPMFRGSKWKKRYEKVEHDIKEHIKDKKKKIKFMSKLMDANKRMEF